jgi:MYXO-CTERM domain-containing protein
MKHSATRKTLCAMTCARGAVVVAAVCLASVGTVRAEMLPSEPAPNAAELLQPDIGAREIVAPWQQKCSVDEWRFVLCETAKQPHREREDQNYHPAPEPSSLALAAFGVAGLLRMRRRTR